jgi:nonsense-mediated mRNA decay protein 3
LNVDDFSSLQSYSVDITEGIPKQCMSYFLPRSIFIYESSASLSFCRNCERFLSPPQTWMLARPESSELLSICLKKLKGLNKVRLTEAHFIWTEPHSKRLRVSMTIQKEVGVLRVCSSCYTTFSNTIQVLTSTILEQIFEIEYLVQHTQCSDCAKLAAKNTWKALVQVRQKVPHKRTFLFLEQLILKHGAQKDTISVKEVRDGLDFFYSQRNHSIKMVEFLAGVVPVRFVRETPTSSYAAELIKTQ